jgi:uncharacterized protein YacL (UPF0231 family)
MTDIQYVASELIERVDQLAIDDVLRAKVTWYLYNVLQNEDTLNESFRALDIAKAKPRDKELSELSMFDLGMRLNELMVASNELNMEYNNVVREIKKRESKLKDDPNLTYKKVR